jgi:hypothetical protein
VQATGSFVPALLVGAAIAVGSALAYLFIIPNRAIAHSELEPVLAIAVGD